MTAKTLFINKIGAVIPTRNRPSQVVRLLDSLSNSSVVPDEVIVVASGQDITEYLLPFKSILNLRYKHTNIRGQVRQKAIAIDMLSSEMNWVLFTDDDLDFSEYAIERALEIGMNWSGSPVIGIGFALPSKSRVTSAPKPIRLAARLAGIDSKHPGRVLKSGHASNYLSVAESIETQWLNGVSLWRLPEAMSYAQVVPTSEYAACEDLFFSYEQSRRGVLVFAPSAKVCYQLEEVTNPENLRVFISSAYWRLAFVRRHVELSITRFLLSQFFRTLFAIRKDPRKTFLLIMSLLFVWRDHLMFRKEEELFLQLARRLDQVSSWG